MIPFPMLFLSFVMAFCLIDSLAIFKNEKEVGIQEICGQCDHDLSNPEHEWSEFKFQDPKTIKLTSYREYVHDSLIAENGSIKEQYDFLEAPTKIDTVTTFLEIGDNGTIYKQEGMVINKFTTSLFADFFHFTYKTKELLVTYRMPGQRWP